MRTLKKILAAVVPAPLLQKILSLYHLTLACCGAIFYGYPSRSLLVVAVTGTKGKTSVTEMVNAVLERAGYRTALINSIRFKLADVSRPNLTRMSTPGRFFTQKFLYDALRSGCTAAVLEATSEGARQHRHRFLDLDALIFTNLAPEHIESHGSYEAYADAKLEIGKQLVRSRKRPRMIVANADDKESGRYLTLPVEHALPFSLSACTPFSANERGGQFTFENTLISLKLPGEFSLKNALASATLARALGIGTKVIAEALCAIERIPGRAERIDAGQDFSVVVDYAHTPDSLTAFYEAYKNVKKICVLGATGGGRDAWKRPIMGRIASEYCAEVILTDEDSYDEDPKQIVDDIAHGMSKKPAVIMDRREAISRALEIALSWSNGSKGQPLDKARDDQNSVAVLITGKGTDPSICGPHGTKTPWSDAAVAREEIEALKKGRGV